MIYTHNIIILNKTKANKILKLSFLKHTLMGLIFARIKFREFW